MRNAFHPFNEESSASVAVVNIEQGNAIVNMKQIDAVGLAFFRG